MLNVFISYVRSDEQAARRIASMLQLAGHSVWFDDFLLPGQNFVDQIRGRLRAADLIIGIISPVTKSSQWVQYEFGMMKALGKVIVPVLIGGATFTDLPPDLADVQSIQLGGFDFQPLVKALHRLELEKPQPKQPTTAAETEKALSGFAKASAQSVREEAMPSIQSDDAVPPTSVFIVHGHDEHMLEEVVRELVELNIEPIVMQRIRTGDDHLFAKFKSVAKKASHALILISGDDIGASYREFCHPAGGTGRLEFRARQNVILELGYFYGRLGEENVFVFQKPPPNSDRVVGKFEEPSDLSGKVFEDFVGHWQTVLRERLKGAGFNF